MLYASQNFFIHHFIFTTQVRTLNIYFYFPRNFKLWFTALYSSYYQEVAFFWAPGCILYCMPIGHGHLMESIGQIQSETP